MIAEASCQTNIAEGWHRSFNSMLGCSTSKPTIGKFLDCVKAEHSLNIMKKTKKIKKESPEERAARWINYDRRIQDYQNYVNKLITAVGNLTMRLLSLKNDDSVRFSARLWTEYIIYFYKKVRSSVRLFEAYYTLMRLINKLGPR